MANSSSRDLDLVSSILKDMDENEGYHPDVISLLYISTPLRRGEHIDHAADTMRIFGADSVVSIQEELAPCYHHNASGLSGINYGQEGQPRLERAAIYKGNGCVFFHKVKNMEDGRLFGKKVGHITMLPEESVKINSDFEFWLAENIIKNYPMPRAIYNEKPMTVTKSLSESEDLVPL